MKRIIYFGWYAEICHMLETWWHKTGKFIKAMDVASSSTFSFLRACNAVFNGDRENDNPNWALSTDSILLIERYLALTQLEKRLIKFPLVDIDSEQQAITFYLKKNSKVLERSSKNNFFTETL